MKKGLKELWFLIPSIFLSVCVAVGISLFVAPYVRTGVITKWQYVGCLLAPLAFLTLLMFLTKMLLTKLEQSGECTIDLLECKE